MKTLMSFVIGLGLLSSSIHAAPLTGNIESGAKIHAARCMVCHKDMMGGDGSALYTRNPRRVNDLDGLAQQVNGCNHQLKINLSEKEISDLVRYLNETFYKFK